MNTKQISVIAAAIAVFAAISLPACACSTNAVSDSSSSAASSSASSSSTASSSASSSSASRSATASEATTSTANNAQSTPTQTANGGTATAQNESTPTTQSSNNNTSTANNTAAQPAHQHNWVPITETRTVVDQEAWDEPIYESVSHFGCSMCGEVGAVDGASHLESHFPTRATGGYFSVQEQVGSVHHDVVTHTEEAIVGYRCSSCGATQ